MNFLVTKPATCLALANHQCAVCNGCQMAEWSSKLARDHLCHSMLQLKSVAKCNREMSPPPIQP